MFDFELIVDVTIRALFFWGLIGMVFYFFAWAMMETFREEDEERPSFLKRQIFSFLWMLGWNAVCMLSLMLLSPDSPLDGIYDLTWGKFFLLWSITSLNMTVIHFLIRSIFVFLGWLIRLMFPKRQESCQ